MMKIKMKYNYVQEILKEAHNDTHHQNNATPLPPPPPPKKKKKKKKQSYSLWWGAAGQCTMSHGIFIHMMRILQYAIEMYICN